MNRGTYAWMMVKGCLESLIFDRLAGSSNNIVVFGLESWDLGWSHCLTEWYES
jgi:hypothetical protein